ncbi:MAG: coenzyme F420-0:L-glutamate ligase, partial [Candidatus Peregrinibacteria bacterium]
WHLTIKNYTLIADAGIDRSNANGYYVLWPKNLKSLIKQLRDYLKRKYHLKKLAVIVVDSHLMPLRAGTIGISTGFYGLKPLIDYRGTPDVFGRKLKYTRANIIDSLAAISSLLMGEGKEQTPMLVIRGANFVKFTEKDTARQLLIEPENDVYRPLLKIYRRNRRSTA